MVFVHSQVLEFADWSMGYNAATGEFTDMIKAGIIDPLKVGAATRTGDAQKD